MRVVTSAPMRANTSAVSRTRDSGTWLSRSLHPRNTGVPSNSAADVPRRSRRTDRAAAEHDDAAESRRMPDRELRREARALRESEQHDARARNAGGLDSRPTSVASTLEPGRQSGFVAAQISAMKLCGYHVRFAAAGAR